MMKELLKFREVNQVEEKGFKLPLEKKFYADLIEELTQIIQEIIDRGKLDEHKFICKNEEMFFVKEITDYRGEVVDEDVYSTVIEFDLLSNQIGQQIESEIYNFTYELFYKINKEIIENEELEVYEDDWIEFVFFATNEGIGAISIQDLDLNLTRFNGELKKVNQ